MLGGSGTQGRHLFYSCSFSWSLALRFALVQQLDKAVAENAREGEVRRAGVVLAANGVATLADGASPATLQLRYRIRHGQVWLGTNAFFFQEGTAKGYEAARWGEFRVATDGTVLLTHLRDAELNRLGEQRR